MSAVEHARWLYREWADAVTDGPDDDPAHLQVEAAALAYDMAVAEHYRGRQARLHARQMGDCP